MPTVKAYYINNIYEGIAAFMFPFNTLSFFHSLLLCTHAGSSQQILQFTNVTLENW